MAKVIIETKLKANNGCIAELKDNGLWITGTWPFDEFQALRDYVESHIAEQAATGESKLSELNDANDNPKTEENSE